MPDHLGGTEYQVTEEHGFCRYCQGSNLPVFPSKDGSFICRPCKVEGRDT